MRTIQTWLSDFIKLFIGPHEEGTPDYSWNKIIAFFVILGILAVMLAQLL